MSEPPDNQPRRPRGRATRPLSERRRTGLAGGLGRRYAPAAAVVAALAAVVALGYGTRPESASAGPADTTERLPVETNVLACPELGGTRAARLALATSGRARGDGRAGLYRVNGELGGPTATTEDPGSAWYREPGGGQRGIAVRAVGSLAAGLAVEQTAEWDGTGLAGVGCAPPRMNHWFVGPGPAVQSAGRLVLTNVDATPSTVDVDAFTPQGMVDPDGGRSVTVDPYQRTVLPLDDLVPNTRVLALRVRSTIGRVAAAVLAQTSEPAGVDWLPNARPPATDLVIPGVPKGNHDRQLLLVAPGRQGATVRMHAVTGGGTYVPEGRDTVQVPGGSAVSVNVAAGLSGRVAAIRLTSDAPVTGGVLVTRQDAAGGSDVAFTAATPPLRGSAVAADNRAGGGRQATLLLTAPEGDAEVRVSTVTPDGPTEQSVMARVPGGRSVAVEAPAPRGSRDGFAVVVSPRPGSGTVYGARLLTDSSGTGGLTVLPLVTARTWVTVPSVGDSLSAVLGARGR